MAGSVFAVDKIEVAATAASSVQARTLALLDGQRRALEIVLRRLAREDDWATLPPAATLPVEDLVSGFRIGDEKTTATGYTARLSVRFKPAAMRRLLQDLDIAVSEMQQTPALLLPVLEDGDGLKLWDDNWWQGTWRARDLNNSVVPLITPLGDVEDTAGAGAADILAGSPAHLAALNARYETDTVIVAHALATRSGQLGMTAYIFGAEASDVIIRTYRTGETAERLAGRAADDLLAILSERWKRHAAIDADLEGALLVRTDYEDLRGWNAIQTRLAEADLIRTITIREISAQRAYMDVAFAGSVAQLSDNLEQRGLQLMRDITGWRLSVSETP